MEYFTGVDELVMKTFWTFSPRKHINMFLEWFMFLFPYGVKAFVKLCINSLFFKA